MSRHRLPSARPHSLLRRVAAAGLVVSILGAGVTPAAAESDPADPEVVEAEEASGTPVASSEPPVSEVAEPAPTAEPTTSGPAPNDEPSPEGTGAEPEPARPQARAASMAADENPPVLVDLQFDAGTVDTLGSVDVMLHGTVTVADDVELSTVMVELSPPGCTGPTRSTGLIPVSGTSDTATFTLTINSTAALGEYQSRVQVTDTPFGNATVYGNSCAAGSGAWPAGAQRTVTVIDSTEGDASPVLTGLQFDQDVVDVSGGATLVTGTISARDDIGLSDYYLVIRPPSCSALLFDLGPMTGTSETVAFSFVVPDTVEQGVWTASVRLRDSVSNARNYNDDCTVGTAPWPPGVERSIVIGEEPEDPPVLTDLQFDPDAADPSTEPVSIAGVLSATDDVDLAVATVVLYSPSCLDFVTSEDVGLSGVDDTESFTLTLPVGAEPGQWSAHVVLTDASGASTEYGTPTECVTLEDPGSWPPGADRGVTVGPIDEAAPELIDLQFDPDSYDVTDGDPLTITGTVSVADDVDLDRITVLMAHSGVCNDFGDDIDVAGTSSTQGFAVPVHESSLEPGDWLASVVVTDSSGNMTVYGNACFPAEGAWPAGAERDVELFTTGSIEGTVTDDDGAPLEGVEVSVNPTTTTDAAGDYTLGSVVSGPQAVTFTPADDACEPRTLDVTVPSGGTVTLDAALDCDDGSSDVSPVGDVSATPPVERRASTLPATGAPTSVGPLAAVVWMGLGLLLVRLARPRRSSRV